jgi:hypothetical protein
MGTVDHFGWGILTSLGTCFGGAEIQNMGFEVLSQRGACGICATNHRGDTMNCEVAVGLLGKYSSRSNGERHSPSFAHQPAALL